MHSYLYTDQRTFPTQLRLQHIAYNIYCIAIYIYHMPKHLTPPDDELGINVPVYLSSMRATYIFNSCLSTGPPARRFPTFSYRLCPKDYVSSFVSYVQIKDSARTSENKISEISFFYLLFLYPPMKIFIFQTDPESFHFCFRSLSTTCRPLIHFGRLPVNIFQSFLVLLVRGCSFGDANHPACMNLCFLPLLASVEAYSSPF